MGNLRIPVPILKSSILDFLIKISFFKTINGHLFKNIFGGNILCSDRPHNQKFQILRHFKLDIKLLLRI